MRPIADTRYQTVFDGIEMNVVDVAGEIVVVADGVLPEPALPQRQIAIGMALQRCALFDQGATEMSLDPSLPSGKIGIPGR